MEQQKRAGSRAGRAGQAEDVHGCSSSDLPRLALSRAASQRTESGATEASEIRAKGGQEEEQRKGESGEVE